MSENNPDLLLTGSGEVSNEARWFNVTNTNATGTGSLKQAIQDASLYQGDTCNITFDRSLFASNDYITIVMDSSTPIGAPKGIITIGSNLNSPQRVILDFGDQNPIYASNAEMCVTWSNIVFKNCKRTGNPIIYSSYTGGSDCYMKFDCCAFMDWSVDSRFNICSTSGSGTTFYEFTNCVFVPAQDNASPYGLSWIGKTTAINRFENCTIWYPENATNIPVDMSGEGGYASLILSSNDLSGETWMSDWTANSLNIARVGTAPIYDAGGKCSSFFGCLDTADASEKKQSTLAYDYWGKSRASQSCYGAIRDAFISAESCKQIGAALQESTVDVAKVRCDSSLSAVVVTVDDILYDIANYTAPTLPAFAEGSYIWKTNNGIIALIDYPVKATISDSDVTIGTPIVTDAQGFGLPVSKPNNALISLPNNAPVENGVADFVYSTCVTTVDGHKTTWMYATNGDNIIKKTFWLAPLWNAVGGTRSVVSGQYWKNEHSDFVPDFHGCEFETYHLDNTITGVTKIDPVYITNRSIKFYQYGEEGTVTYKDTDNNDVTQALIDAGLLIFVRSSWLTDVFDDLAQTALYALDVPLELRQADTIFG